MSDLKDEVLQKGVEGAASTDSDLEARAEPLSSSVRPDHILEETDDVFGHFGDVRFVSNPVNDALFSRSTPNNHPKRHRRMLQQLLFFGSEVRAEGTRGFEDGSGNLSTDGVTVDHITSSDAVLVLSNKIADGTDGYYGTYAIDTANSSGDTIVLEDTLQSNTLNPTMYHWQIIVPKPVELVPFPTGDGVGNEKTYLTVLPRDWPVFQRNNEGLDFEPKGNRSLASSYSGQRDSSGYRPQVVVATTTAFFSVGDPVVFAERVFVVHEETFDSTNNEQTLILNPIWGTETEIEDYSQPSRVFKMYTVGDFIDHPTQQETSQQTQRSFANNEKVRDYTRVQNLVSPLQGPSERRGRSSDRVLYPGGRYFDDDFGFGLTLYPDDGTGSADLTSPIRDFSDVTIDSSASGEQEIYVDYQDGIVRLSHSPADGDDLNPNNHRDPNGRVNLYATFFAYQGASAPNVSKGLESGNDRQTGASGEQAARPKDTSEIQFKTDERTNDTEPVELFRGWTISGQPDTDNSTYHLDPADVEAGGYRNSEHISDEAPSTNSPVERGITHYTQHRERSTGFYHLSAYGVAKDSGGSRAGQFFVMPNVLQGGRREFTDDPSSHFAINSGDRVLRSQNTSSFSVSNGDSLFATFLDESFSISYSSSQTFTPEEFANDLNSKIQSATSLSAPDDFEFFPTRGSSGVTLRVSGLTYLGTGGIIPILGGTFQTDTRYKADRLDQRFGYEGSYVNRLRWVYNSTSNSGRVSFDGIDITLDGGGASNRGFSENVGSLRDITEVEEKENPRYVKSGLGIASVSTANSEVGFNSGEAKVPASPALGGRSILDVPQETIQYSAGIESVDTDSSAGDYDMGIAVDSSGLPRLAYYHSGNNELRSAKWDGSSWTVEVVDSFSSAVDAHIDITYDDSDTPWIAYRDEDADDLNAAYRSGGSWTIEVVHSSTDVLGTDCAITTTTNDIPIISYQNFTLKNTRAANRSGGTWSNELVDSSSDVGYNTDITTDSSDNTYITYVNGNNDVIWVAEASGTGGTWTLNNVVDVSGQSSVTVAIGQSDLSISGNWSIAYSKRNTDFSPPKDFLEYLDEGGSSEVITDRDEDNRSSHVDLKFDDEQNAHVAYIGFDNPPKVIDNRNGSGEWRTKTVADVPAGSTGALAFEPVSGSVEQPGPASDYGVMHIGFQDDDNQNVKYSRKFGDRNWYYGDHYVFVDAYTGELESIPMTDRNFDPVLRRPGSQSDLSGVPVAKVYNDPETSDIGATDLRDFGKSLVQNSNRVITVGDGSDTLDATEDIRIRGLSEALTYIDILDDWLRDDHAFEIHLTEDVDILPSTEEEQSVNYWIPDGTLVDGHGHFVQVGGIQSSDVLAPDGVSGSYREMFSADQCAGIEFRDIEFFLDSSSSVEFPFMNLKDCEGVVLRNVELSEGPNSTNRFSEGVELHRCDHFEISACNFTTRNTPLRMKDDETVKSPFFGGRVVQTETSSVNHSVEFSRLEGVIIERCEFFRGDRTDLSNPERPALDLTDVHDLDMRTSECSGGYPLDISDSSQDLHFKNCTFTSGGLSVTSGEGSYITDGFDVSFVDCDFSASFPYKAISTSGGFDLEDSDGTHRVLEFTVFDGYQGGFVVDFLGYMKNVLGSSVTFLDPTDVRDAIIDPDYGLERYNRGVDQQQIVAADANNSGNGFVFGDYATRPDVIVGVVDNTESLDSSGSYVKVVTDGLNFKFRQYDPTMDKTAHEVLGFGSHELIQVDDIDEVRFSGCNFSSSSGVGSTAPNPGGCSIVNVDRMYLSDCDFDNAGFDAEEINNYPSSVGTSDLDPEDMRMKLHMSNCRFENPSAGAPTTMPVYIHYVDAAFQNVVYDGAVGNGQVRSGVPTNSSAAKQSNTNEVYAGRAGEVIPEGPFILGGITGHYCSIDVSNMELNIRDFGNQDTDFSFGSVIENSPTRIAGITIIHEWGRGIDVYQVSADIEVNISDIRMELKNKTSNVITKPARGNTGIDFRQNGIRWRGFTSDNFITGIAAKNYRDKDVNGDVSEAISLGSNTSDNTVSSGSIEKTASEYTIDDQGAQNIVDYVREINYHDPVSNTDKSQILGTLHINDGHTE